MTIDVLSRPGEIPIVMGDEEDMAAVVGVGLSGGEAHLVMACESGTRQAVRLTAEASRNFAAADHVLLLELTPDDRVASAFRMPMNGGERDMTELDRQEIEQLTHWWRPKAS